jgi:hypothetical protein
MVDAAIIERRSVIVFVSSLLNVHVGNRIYVAPAGVRVDKADSKECFSSNCKNIGGIAGIYSFKFD